MTIPPEAFTRRSARMIVGVGLASLAAGAAAGILGEDLGPRPTHEPSTFSPSALGHGALREVLERIGIPVVISRADSGRRAAAGGLLIVAEPARLEELRSMIASARRTLLVLPKWTGTPHPVRSDWVDEARLLPAGSVEAILREAGIQGFVQRVGQAPSGWRDLPGPAPRIQVLQVLRGDGLVPRIACHEGILLARVGTPEQGDRELWVLSDPDLLSNHGLAKEGNAELAVAILRELCPDAGPLIVDETVHGYRRPSSLWRELSTFPLALASLQVLLVAALLAWVAGVRFGEPIPIPPPLEPGKALLLENTARLLRAGGHSRPILTRYYRTAVRAAAASLRAPGLPGSEESVAFLDRVAASRGMAFTASTLGARVKEALASPGDPSAPLEDTARLVHAWREEITRGA